MLICFVCVYLFSREGILGFYKGLTAILWRQALYSTSRFFVWNTAKDQYSKRFHKKTGVAFNLLAGMAAYVLMLILSVSICIVHKYSMHCMLPVYLCFICAAVHVLQLPVRPLICAWYACKLTVGCHPRNVVTIKDLLMVYEESSKRKALVVAGVAVLPTSIVPLLQRLHSLLAMSMPILCLRARVCVDPI